MLLIETRFCTVESTGAMYLQLICAYSPPHLHINYITYSIGTGLSPQRGGHSGKKGHSGESCLWPMLSLGRYGVPISPRSGQGLQRQAWHQLSRQRHPSGVFPRTCVLVADMGRGQRCSLAGKAAATARCCSGMSSSAGTVALKPFISV